MDVAKMERSKIIFRPLGHLLTYGDVGECRETMPRLRRSMATRSDMISVNARKKALIRTSMLESMATHRRPATQGRMRLRCNVQIFVRSQVTRIDSSPQTVSRRWGCSRLEATGHGRGSQRTEHDSSPSQGTGGTAKVAQRSFSLQ